MHAKTGIASRRLKPLLGLLDPENTRSLPPQVAASTGLDVLSHALESYTALPFDQRPHPERPALRPAYQGSNPISDVWSLQALRMVARYLVAGGRGSGRRRSARRTCCWRRPTPESGSATPASICRTACRTRSRAWSATFMPPVIRVDHAMVPHGFSVILNAPAVFRFTAPACPERHLEAAEALGADVSHVQPEDAGDGAGGRGDCLHAKAENAQRTRGGRVFRS